MKKIIVFSTVHYTIKADKVLQEKGFEYQIVTTPRDISSDCGMSIETNSENFEKIYSLLDSIGLKMEIYEME